MGVGSKEKRTTSFDEGTKSEVGPRGFRLTSNHQPRSLSFSTTSMGKTKAKRAEVSAQFKEIKAARKAAQAELDDDDNPPSSSSSSQLPPLKRPKLNNSTSRNNRKPFNEEDKLGNPFFPIGLPLEGQNGERELDEAEKYLLSVR